MAKKGLKDLSSQDNYVALAIVDAGNYQQTNSKIIKELIKKSLPGVYVSLNRPYEDIKSNFEKKKINLQCMLSLFFLQRQ
tara:strand:+ start:838 stop:1077 length:240 start_codon:yes stop_codon:yes gene_type:complete